MKRNVTVPPTTRFLDGARALVIAAATATFICGAMETLTVLSWDEDQPRWPRQGLLDILEGVQYFLPPLVGGALLAMSLWLWARVRGRGSWWLAALLGFAATGVIYVPYFMWVLGFPGVLYTLPLSTLDGLVGAVSCLAGWCAVRSRA
jgi:hypothetical protein